MSNENKTSAASLSESPSEGSQSPPPVTPGLREVLEAIERAEVEIAHVCRERWEGREGWRTSIPARPGYDTDLILSDALTKARAALSSLGAAPRAQEEADLVDAMEKCPLAKGPEYRNGWADAIAYLRTLRAQGEGKEEGPVAPGAVEAVKALENVLSKTGGEVSKRMREEIVKHFSRALAALPVSREPAGTNRYGVDVGYFRRELAALAESLPNRPPDELARYLQTLAATAATGAPSAAGPAVQGVDLDEAHRIASLMSLRVGVASALGFTPPTDADGFWGHPTLGPVHDDDLNDAMISLVGSRALPEAAGKGRECWVKWLNGPGLIESRPITARPLTSVPPTAAKNCEWVLMVEPPAVVEAAPAAGREELLHALRPLVQGALAASVGGQTKEWLCARLRDFAEKLEAIILTEEALGAAGSPAAPAAVEGEGAGLTWTREKPKVKGDYRHRVVGEPDRRKWGVSYIMPNDGNPLWWDEETEVWYQFSDKVEIEWMGPFPEPQGSTEGAEGGDRG